MEKGAESRFMHNKFLFFLGLIGTGLLAIQGKAVAQTSQPDQLPALYTKKSIKLDGRLTEAPWQNATKIDNFTQRELNEGASATEKTKVAVVYTDRYFYLGIWCYSDHPSKRIAREYRRDFSSGDDDNFKIILDTYNDDRNGYLFITNPNGARRDAQVLNNGNNVNTSWDGVWNVKTRKNEKGWFAEVKIPFTALKYDPNVKEQVWGANFERNIQHKREQVLWQGWSRDANIRQVNRAGRITGLDSMISRDFVEIRPYGLGGAEIHGDEDEAAIGDIGGNVNYLITPTVRAQLTVNTDFAQVEADNQQINLTRFPLFFKEKREFFLEGRDYFDLGFGGNRITPFYTRRIGLTEDREQVPILGGGRLLGKIKNSTMGFMSLQTGEAKGQPSTNYTIGSWRQDVLEQSTMGVLSVNKLVNGRWHTTSGINGRYSTSDLFGDKNMNVGGTLVHTQNNEDGYRPKANAYRVYAQYPNDKLDVFTSYQRSPEPFDPEVGLMRRRNFEEIFGSITYKPRPQSPSLNWIRQFRFTPLTITYNYFHDSRALQNFSWQVQPLGFDTRSGESFDFTVTRSGEGLQQPFDIREGITIKEGEYWQTRYNLSTTTFSGRIISGSVNVDWGGFFDGRSVESSYGLRWRASQFLDVNFSYEKNWVWLAEGNFDTDLVSNRLRYAFNPDLFGSIFTQWNDLDQIAMMNFRLRWIPKPGTDFYLIFNQNMNTQGRQWENNRTAIMGKLIWRFVI